MNNIIKSISEFKSLTSKGITCIAEEHNGIVKFLNVTTNSELISYFCKDESSIHRHTPKSIIVSHEEIKVFDILAREYIAINLNIFHGYCFNVATASAPKPQFETNEKIDFSSAVDALNTPAVLINTVDGGEFCNVVMLGTQENPKAEIVNDMGVKPCGEQVVFNKASTKLTDIAIVLSSELSPSFLYLDEENSENITPVISDKKAILLGVIMSAVEGKEFVNKSINILKP